MSGISKDEALERMKSVPVESAKVRRVVEGSYRRKSAAELRASGYVLHTLEAALWSFANTHGFREAVLDAVNLGEDADTTGAVVGQIAGACDGVEGIPPEWLRKLAMREEIDAMALRLIQTGESGCDLKPVAMA